VGGLNMPHRGMFKGNVSAKGTTLHGYLDKGEVSMKTIIKLTAYFRKES